MKNRFICSLVAVASICLQNAGAAESTTSQWTVNYSLPKNIPTISNHYLQLATLESNSNEFLQEILVEIMPTYTTVAKNFGIEVLDANRFGGEYGTKGGPSRIAVNFRSTNDDVISKFNLFRKEQFGESGQCGFGYKWTKFYIYHEYNSRNYSCISFPMDEYKNINKVFNQLATLANFSEDDQKILSQVYAKIEECAQK